MKAHLITPTLIKNEIKVSKNKLSSQEIISINITTKSNSLDMNII